MLLAWENASNGVLGHSCSFNTAGHIPRDYYLSLFHIAKKHISTVLLRKYKRIVTPNNIFIVLMNRRFDDDYNLVEMSIH